MTAYTGRKHVADQPPGMSKSLVASLCFHGCVVLIGIFGLPYIKKDIDTVVQPVPIELVEISDQTMTDKPFERAPIAEEKPEPPKLEPERPKQAPQQTAEEPPRPVAAPQEELAMPDDDIKKPAEVKPKEKPPVPKQRPIIVKESAEAKPKEDPFQSLLKNLQEEKPVSKEGEGKTAAASEQTQPLPLGERLTITEKDALALQLRNCWNVLAGARYAENLVVDLKLFMNSDGTLRQAVVVDQIRYNTDTIYRAAADSALRAVRDPNCTPFDLPLNKYNGWKVINATFDPSQIL